QECRLSGSSRRTRTAKRSCESTGPTSRATTTSAQSVRTTSRRSTCFAEDSPAKTLVSQDAKQDSTVSGRVFGSSTSDSLASYDQAGSWWKTSHNSVSTSRLLPADWPKSGMTRNGTLYPLLTSVPRISASGSGLWGTPTARDHKDTGDLSRVPVNG